MRQFADFAAQFAVFVVKLQFYSSKEQHGQKILDNNRRFIVMKYKMV